MKKKKVGDKEEIQTDTEIHASGVPFDELAGALLEVPIREGKEKKDEKKAKKATMKK